MNFAIQILSTSTEQTIIIGQLIGRAVRGGEFIELNSDIGGGKTTFTKGIASGMGISEPVQSPTFTISRMYKAKSGLELHHYDFYRLQDSDGAGIMAAALAESLSQTNAVVVVEWSNVVDKVLPKNRLQIAIKATSTDTRVLDFKIPAAYDYLEPALKTFLSTRSLA